MYVRVCTPMAVLLLLLLAAAAQTSIPWRLFSSTMMATRRLNSWGQVRAHAHTGKRLACLPLQGVGVVGAEPMLTFVRGHAAVWYASAVRWHAWLWCGHRELLLHLEPVMCIAAYLCGMTCAHVTFGGCSNRAARQAAAAGRSAAHLVLALLIHVPLMTAVPGHVAVLLAALIQGDEQMGAVVPPGIGQPSFVHLLLQAAYMA